jgi:hypothetical protein
MLPIRQGNTQVYTPFGTYVVEQRDDGFLRRFLDDLPRPDLKFGPAHPLVCEQEGRRAA